MVSYTEPKTLHHVFESDYETYFVTPFSLVVFVFVSSLPFFISFYVCSFLYVFSISVSLFQILNAKNTTLIQNFASCFCLQLDYITIYFPLAGCICLRICFISFCPRTIWDKYDTWLRFVVCCDVQGSALVSNTVHMFHTTPPFWRWNGLKSNLFQGFDLT